MPLDKTGKKILRQGYQSREELEILTKCQKGASLVVLKTRQKKTKAIDTNSNKTNNNNNNNNSSNP